MSKKMGSFKSNDLKKLQKNLEKLQNPEAFVEACAKELAARLLSLVIKRTPVGQYSKGSGKTGGTLRRGWTGSKSQSSASSYANTTKVNYFDGTYVIDIINPVEYASYVEYGHRKANHKGWVKGKFMMTISEQELEKITPRILENRIKKYMEGCMK